MNKRTYPKIHTLTNDGVLFRQKKNSFCLKFLEVLNFQTVNNAFDIFGQFDGLEH